MTPRFRDLEPALHLRSKPKPCAAAAPASVASVRAVLGLVASVMASTAHAADPGGAMPDAKAFATHCTRLVGGDLVLRISPSCTGQLATEAGKQAFRGVVQAEVGSLERRRAASAHANSAQANLARLSQLAAQDGDPSARRAASYAIRQAQTIPQGPQGAGAAPMP